MRFPMWIGLGVFTRGALLLAFVFFLGQTLFLGVPRSNPRLLGLVLKPNTVLWHLLLLINHGFFFFFVIWGYFFLEHPSSSVIMLVLFT
jgi:hypothetical protein